MLESYINKGITFERLLLASKLVPISFYDGVITLGDDYTIGFSGRDYVNDDFETITSLDPIEIEQYVSFAPSEAATDSTGSASSTLTASDEVGVIEELLAISISTVKNHIYNIYQKVGINSRVQLFNIIQKQQIEWKIPPNGG